jgi:phosphoribosyl-ATP pyrophosphohydrolase
LFKVICDGKDTPNPESYTCKLLRRGDNKILKKIGEESAEVVMACKDKDGDAIAAEVANLFIIPSSPSPIIKSPCEMSIKNCKTGAGNQLSVISYQI